METFDLTGKTALITGAGGLLGPQHALALRASGASVVLTDVSKSLLDEARDRLEEYEAPGRIDVFEMDVTSEDSIGSTANQLAGLGIEVSILINNAAINPKVSEHGDMQESSRLENFSLQEWDMQLSVGLTGAFLCAKIFGSRMATSGKGGVILNIASDLSVIAPDQRLYKKTGIADDQQPVKPVTYSVIKAGLIGLTRYLSTYWPDRGVRCNALSPGGVDNGQPGDFMQNINSLIPMGRMAEQNEYWGAIQFLCSDASKYMNGQNIVIDGGRSAW